MKGRMVRTIRRGATNAGAAVVTSGKSAVYCFLRVSTIAAKGIVYVAVPAARLSKKAEEILSPLARATAVASKIPVLPPCILVSLETASNFLSTCEGIAGATSYVSSQIGDAASKLVNEVDATTGGESDSDEFFSVNSDSDADEEFQEKIEDELHQFANAVQIFECEFEKNPNPKQVSAKLLDTADLESRASDVFVILGLSENAAKELLRGVGVPEDAQMSVFIDQCEKNLSTLDS